MGNCFILGNPQQYEPPFWGDTSSIWVDSLTGFLM